MAWDLGEMGYMRAVPRNPLTGAVRTGADAPTSVTFTPHRPGGTAPTAVAGEPDPEVPGGWRAPVTPEVAGRWVFRAVALPGPSVEYGSFYVRAPPA